MASCSLPMAELHTGFSSPEPKCIEKRKSGKQAAQQACLPDSSSPAESAARIESWSTSSCRSKISCAFSLDLISPEAYSNDQAGGHTVPSSNQNPRAKLDDTSKDADDHLLPPPTVPYSSSSDPELLPLRQRLDLHASEEVSPVSSSPDSILRAEELQIRVSFTLPI